MTTLKPFIILVLAAGVVLSACDRKNSKLMNLRASGYGPDEFAILPTKPLEAPKNFATLPDPTPGGTNLADVHPAEEAAAALGGSAKAVNRTGIPASDSGVIAVATRYGVAQDIRATLAADDQVYRSKHRGKLLERLFGNTVYFNAYEPLSLDRYAELLRLRRAGVKTPAAPPEPKK